MSAFDLDAAVAALREEFPQATVSVEPSNVAGSPYEYVYLYLAPGGDPEGPFVLVSDPREWEDRDGYLVSAHRSWEAFEEDQGGPDDADSLEDALALAREGAAEVTGAVDQPAQAAAEKARGEGSR